jgi:hypothetical protein
MLIGRAESGSPHHISRLHPEYAVGSPSGCYGCLEAHVVFTPYADPADVRRLMDINFSCLTRWHPCQKQEDILPTGWNAATAEGNSEKTAAQRPCGPEVVRVLSRESLRVAIGTVTTSETASGKGTVRVDEDLKPGDFRFAPKEYSFVRPLRGRERLRGRYILFFEYLHSDPFERNSTCWPLPASAENMIAARRGLAETWLDHR